MKEATMKLTVGLTTALVIASFVPGQLLAAGAEETAVKKVVEQVSYATSIEEGLAAYDPSIVQDDFFGPQRRGVADVRKDFDVYMQNYNDFKSHIEDITVDVQGNLAVAYSHQHFHATGKNGTPDLDTIVRQTDVLRRAGGKWLITYEHLSLPIDLKTGKATLNRATR
jgi:ketosteroid isomerase-like protein